MEPAANTLTSSARPLATSRNLVGPSPRCPATKLRTAISPTVPLAVVADRFSDRYNAAARALGLRKGSVLLPDLGGALSTSELLVIDLVGLCDRSIALAVPQ